MAKSLFQELKRRNVFKVAAAYAIVSWLIIQVIGSITPMLDLPDVFGRMVLVLLLIGFPIALVFAWAFEMTPEGIKKESDVVRDESITDTTGKKLEYSIIGLLVIVLGYFLWNSQTTQKSEPIAQPKTSTSATDNPQIETVREKSIAVLPFTNMTNNPESEPITVGLHDDLLTHISKISELKVISRTSVLRYKDTKKSISEIAKELGVANILEGGVQKSGNQIRINVQLIDAQTDQHLWAEIYDRELTANNIFKIQTEISEKIAAALKATLSPHELQSLNLKPTDNLDAYNAYNAGRQRILNRNTSDLKQALILFQRATELDPNFALAYVGQANTLKLLKEYSDLSYSDMLSQGEPLVAKALSLAPELAEAHTSKAGYLLGQGHYVEAENTFKYSLNLNPNYATTYHWYGRMLRKYLGRYSEALALHRKAAELDPMSAVILQNVGWSLFSNGSQQEALIQFHRVHELHPDYPEAYVGIAQVNSLKGNFDKAVIWSRKSVVSDSGNANWVTELVNTYLNIGDIKSAKLALTNSKNINPHHQNYIYSELNIDLFSGNKQVALKRIEDALKDLPDNPQLKDFYIFVSMLNGQHKNAIDNWLSLYPSNNGKTFQLTTSNFDTAPALAWSLKQSGKVEQAEQIIIEALKLIKEVPFTRIGWLRIELLAVQGNAHVAALAYARAVNNNAIRNWWIIDQMPYFDEVKKQPEYIKAHQQLMENLKAQREKLAQHDLLEKAQ